MFGLAIFSTEQELHYWIGGELWEAHPEEAVRFYSQTNAEATMDLLKRTLPNLSPTVHVAPLPSTGKFDNPIEWFRNQMESAKQTLSDLTAGKKLEIGGRDVTQELKTTYERIVAQWKNLIDAYYRRRSD